MKKSVTQKWELEQLTELEEQSGIPLPQTRETIRKLDEVAPNRLKNIFSSGWKGMEGVEPHSPVSMFTDILHLLSWYAPDTTKFFLVPFGKSVSPNIKDIILFFV